LVRDQPLFAFAGLYTECHDPAETPFAQYTIITTEPDARAATVHNLVPMILPSKSEEIWFSGEQPYAGQLKEMFVPFPAENMARHPVSPQVNVLSADDDRVVRPVGSLDDDYTQ